MEQPSESEECLRKLKMLGEQLKAIHISKPILTQTHFFEEIRRGNDLKKQELEKEHARLLESTASLERELQHKEELLQKETMVVSQQEKLVNEKMQDMKVRDQCKKQYNQRLANASGKISAKDQRLLANFKQKLKAYKMFTGIVWDYPNCNDKKLCGYIRDESDRQLKMFHIDLPGKTEEEITSEMWKICAQKSVSGIVNFSKYTREVQSTPAGLASPQHSGQYSFDTEGRRYSQSGGYSGLKMAL